MKPRKSPTTENSHLAHQDDLFVSPPEANDTSEKNDKLKMNNGSISRQENRTDGILNTQMSLGEASGGTMIVKNGGAEDVNITNIKPIVTQNHHTSQGTKPPEAYSTEIDEERKKIKEKDVEKISKNRTRDEIRETRKRKVKQISSPMEGDDIDGSRRLRAINKAGREIKVKIIISSRPYLRERSSSEAQAGKNLGQDGNQHYCQVCRGFGNVVCCDGCPKVYHHDCLPLHSTSRVALENDEDPWYCPKCVEKAKKNQTKKTNKNNGSEKHERSSANRRCVDCGNTQSEYRLTPCVDCGAYIHFPHCYDGDRTTHSMDTMSANPVCRNCKVIDQDESDISANQEKLHKKIIRTQNSDTDGSDVEEAKVVSIAKEKKILNVKASLLGNRNKESSEMEKKAKKKKKNRKRSASEIEHMENEEDEAARQQSIKDDPILQPRGSSTGVQAIPAFCFYLAENRWKIERSLSRKHRTFLRLPKGDERNALVAQEAAIWWTKLEPSEHKLYIQMAIRDFESRVITWKEEKLARELSAEDDGVGGQHSDDNGFAESSTKLVDLQQTYDLHERLYLSTSVGSKLFRIESGQSYNRVLLDLLHDIRFNPLPMLNVNRRDIDDLLSDENKKAAIPFFEVHGPVSTYIGDECLGCSRGWTHFCTVLQCKVPTVENRAKLQPPLSSLLATRIGLGLRPRNEESEEVVSAVTDENQKHKLFQWREANNNEAKGLFNVPSCHVYDPSDRADDMVLFIEETAAMKVPEPPRPTNPNQHKKAAIRVLPTQRQRDGQPDGDDEIGDFLMHNKCGRCRTMIQNDAGCVPCRRAQLVINKSKVPTFVSPKNGDGKSLKVHTIMLGRLHAKDGTGEIQNSSDQRVSEALLKERWFPSAILPPQKVKVPIPKLIDTGSDVEDVSSEDGEDVDAMSIIEESSNGDVELSFDKNSMTDAKNLLELAELINRVTNATHELPATRVRSARSMSMVDKEIIVSEPERPQLQKHYKKETAEIMKKVTRIACLGIMHAIMRRDPLRIFENIANTEGTVATVQHYIDFKEIRVRLLAGNYESLASFVADVRNLCDAAIANNPPTTIHFKTAKEISIILPIMHSRANTWISTIRSEKIKSLQKKEVTDRPVEEVDDENDESFIDLQKTQPHSVWMLGQEERLRNLVESDFRRTAENETSYYGCLSIGRAASAAEASLAPYPDSSGQHTVVPLRKYFEDEDLREYIDRKVSDVQFPQLKNVSSWREELILRLIRKVQKLRLDRLQNMDKSCSRLIARVHDVNGIGPHSIKTDITIPARTKRRKVDQSDTPRVANSRGLLVTGLASAKTCQRILQRSMISGESDFSAYTSINDVCVSVRGSKIHGIGLFADQPFAIGDFVAEYVGECIVNPVSNLREQFKEEHRIQDYHFRLDDNYVIDATTRGSWARYINHSCTPNCKTVIIPGDESNPLSYRVLIVAKRSIEFNEELTFDYQFPLELDLNARIPCNCQSDSCRGFMNWDLPEKGSNNRILLVHKRGANMRDRIRRLGRPLKRDEM